MINENLIETQEEYNIAFNNAVKEIHDRYDYLTDKINEFAYENNFEKITQNAYVMKTEPINHQNKENDEYTL